MNNKVIFSKQFRYVTGGYKVGPVGKGKQSGKWLCIDGVKKFFESANLKRSRKMIVKLTEKPVNQFSTPIVLKKVANEYGDTYIKWGHNLQTRGCIQENFGELMSLPLNKATKLFVTITHK